MLLNNCEYNANAMQIVARTQQIYCDFRNFLDFFFLNISDLQLVESTDTDLADTEDQLYSIV